MDNQSYIIMLHKLSLKHKKPVNEIKRIIESQFEFIQETTKKLDFSKITSEEELNKLKTNFNVKYLFTLHSLWNVIKAINKLEDETKSTSN
jgi:hypothetical protein